MLHNQCYTINVTQPMLHNQCCTIEVSEATLHSQCCTVNVAQSMLRKQCCTINVTQSRSMLQSQCYTINVTQSMLHSQCYTANVTQSMLHTPSCLWYKPNQTLLLCGSSCLSLRLVWTNQFSASSAMEASLAPVALLSHSAEAPAHVNDLSGSNRKQLSPHASQLPKGL